MKQGIDTDFYTLLFKRIFILSDLLNALEYSSYRSYRAP